MTKEIQISEQERMGLVGKKEGNKDGNKESLLISEYRGHLKDYYTDIYFKKETGEFYFSHGAIKEPVAVFKKGDLKVNFVFNEDYLEKIYTKQTENYPYSFLTNHNFFVCDSLATAYELLNQRFGFTYHKSYNFEIGELADLDRAGWSVDLSKNEQGEINKVVIANAHFGKYTYGLRPEGYDGVIYEEVGGGGALAMFTFELNGKMYFSLIPEKRLNLGTQTPVYCCAGGFKKANETSEKAALRELEEETGVGILSDIEKVAPGITLINSQCLGKIDNRALSAAEIFNGQGLSLSIIHIDKNFVDKYLRISQQDNSIRFNKQAIEEVGLLADSPKLSGRIEEIVFMNNEELSALSPDIFALSSAELARVEVKRMIEQREGKGERYFDYVSLSLLINFLS